MRILFSIPLFIFVGLGACSDAASSSSTAACTELSACCPMSGAEASCNLTVKTGNGAQCATTLAALQDAKKCPKGAWSCTASVGNNPPTTTCTDYPKSTGFMVCEGSGMLASDGSCAKENVLGRCTITAGGGTPTVITYYDAPPSDPARVDAAKGDCSSRGGTWK